MIPTAWAFLDSLPVTANGKLDRQALPAPDQPTSVLTYTAPTSPAERAVADAWGSVLGLGRVSVHDNFFALGGDSIRSLKVIARLREAGYEVEVAQLFLAQTVGELARSLARAEPAPAVGADGAFGMLSDDDRARLAERFQGGPS
jgi:aryl carrier-like protein